MKNIAIYGAGGFGREIACLIKRINEKNKQWDFIGFFDDGKDRGSHNEYGKILGGISELNSWKSPLSIVIAIGSPKILFSVVSKISNKLVDFPNIIAPDVTFLDYESLQLGKGNLICSSCLFSCNIKIGDFNIFNGFITVGHDTQIGNYNSLMPAVRVSGEVGIGNCNFFGVSSVVLQQIQIGCNTIIGTNSVVIRKTKDGNTYVGNPASIVRF